MAVPIFLLQPNKILTPLIVAAGALLVAAAPPDAVAPDLAARVACAPAHDESVSNAVEPLDATQRALVEHLAVISIESRFNPIAESVMGAKGLMQIIPKYHLDKLNAAGGEDAVLDPESNIQVGARILQEYVHRTGRLEQVLRSRTGKA